MKKNMKRVIALLLGVLLCLSCGCGKVYTCGTCGEKTKKAYYDPYDEENFFCESCAKEYFRPFPIKEFLVE